MAEGPVDRAYLVYRGGSLLLRLLPRRVALALGAAAGRAAARRAGGARSVVRANLSHVIGADGSPAGSGVLEALTTEAFVQYGRYWAVTARLRPRDRRKLERQVVVEGRENFELFHQSPVIYALPHLGAWELGGFWTIENGLDLTTVVEPAKTERLSEFFTAARTSIGLHVVPLGSGTAKQLLSVLDEGRSVALVADRDLLGDGIEVDFFGAPTRLPAGPALLALRSGAHLVPVGTYLEADGRVRVVFSPPIDTRRLGRLREDVVRVTHDLTGAFEELIRRDPAQWHVFQPNWPEDRAVVAR